MKGWLTVKKRNRSGRRANPITALKKSIDKSINSLNRNTQEIEAVLNTLTEVDKDTISPNDKKELERLTKELLDINNLIDEIIGE